VSIISRLIARRTPTDAKRGNEPAMSQPAAPGHPHTVTSFAALEVWRSDGAIDALFTSLFRELLTYMMEDPRSIGFCTHLLFCAKNLERVGDHATNIAETAHYVITGEILAIERPKADDSIVTEPSLRPPHA
jgi:hypothetical protein